MKTSRRNFITKSMLATAGFSAGLNSILDDTKNDLRSAEFTGIKDQKDEDSFSISIFSKHLHWLGYDEMAKVVAEIGFDGVDLTVRPEGHVVPEKVETDLPKAVEAISKAGKKVIMITTAIDNADDLLTVKILKTASSLGIRHYRMGWWHYDETRSVEENIRGIQNRLSKLVILNEKYSISGEYQNHSGVAREGIYFGGAIWDIAGVLKNVNSAWIGSQYDILHATVEGANTWPIGLKLISPYIRSIDIKDFRWTEKDGKWLSETVPLGDGMVDFKKFFGLVKDYSINVPVSVHYEYPLGGAENGAKVLNIKREDVISAMKKDLLTLRKFLSDTNLV